MAVGSHLKVGQIHLFQIDCHFLYTRQSINQMILICLFAEHPTKQCLRLRCQVHLIRGQDIATWLTAFLILTNYHFLTSWQNCKTDYSMTKYTKHVNHWTHASVSQITYTYNYIVCFVFYILCFIVCYSFILKYSLTYFVLCANATRNRGVYLVQVRFSG